MSAGAIGRILHCTGRGPGTVRGAVAPCRATAARAEAMLDITARQETMTGLRFRLSLFGPFRLAGPAGRIELGSRKLPALLAYLACAGPEPQPRDAVMALLWEGPQPKAQQSLRQALMRLRRI